MENRKVVIFLITARVRTNFFKMLLNGTVRVLNTVRFNLRLNSLEVSRVTLKWHGLTELFSSGNP